MDDTQVQHIEEELNSAIASNDPLQIMKACAISLKTTARCTAHTGERSKDTIVKLNELLSIKEDVKDLQQRVLKLEEKEAERDVQKYERRGAGKMLKFLYASGLLIGGVGISRLPEIIHAICESLAK